VRLLEVDDLSVRLLTEEGAVQAVDGISFQVAERDIVALVGESGCGKSLTALSLTRLLPPNAQVSGRVMFEEENLIELGVDRLRRLRGKEIAYVFQEPMTALNPSFSVGFQITEVLRAHEGISRRAADRRCLELLQLVGIPAPARRAREYPHQLSGGMRQRIMIAIAIACEPRLLIADEPTTALDVTIQADILDLLRDLRDRLRMAVLFITHDLGVVADIADRVVVMYAGRKVEEAPVEELFKRPLHPYTIGLLGAVPLPVQGVMPRRLREIPGVVPSLAEPMAACTFAARCPRVTAECRERVPPLTSEEQGHLVACFHPGPEQ
jgi:peptide/nickel transport system ATP-binding protein